MYKAFDYEEGIEVAWNQVRASDFVSSKKDEERLQLEVEMLRSLDHPCLMKFYHSWIDPKNLTINFITELFTSGTLRQCAPWHVAVSDVRGCTVWGVGGAENIGGHTASGLRVFFT